MMTAMACLMRKEQWLLRVLHGRFFILTYLTFSAKQHGMTKFEVHPWGTSAHDAKMLPFFPLNFQFVHVN